MKKKIASTDNEAGFNELPPLRRAEELKTRTVSSTCPVSLGKSLLDDLDDIDEVLTFAEGHRFK